MKASERRDWQADPETIETSSVQFWSDGVMTTAMMPRETARRLVADGTAFVITGQAIGRCEG